MIIYFITDILFSKFGVPEKEIISKISRWFTGAKDRHGGRKERLLLKDKESRQNE